MSLNNHYFLCEISLYCNEKKFTVSRKGYYYDNSQSFYLWEYVTTIL